MTILKNVTYYDFKNYKNNAFIVFDEQIKHIGDMKDFNENIYENTEIIDAEDHLVIPSLVVGHTHIYSTLSRGLSVNFNPKNFKELLEQLWWKLDGQLDKDDIYYSGIVNGIEYVKNGVTTLIDHHASGLMIEGSLEELKNAVVNDIGLRGMFCFETSDRFDVDSCIRENISFINNNNTPMVKGLFGAHAMLSLSDNTLKLIKENIGDTPLHIHVAESLVDEEECERLYGERVVERLERFGLLNPNSILSHCIHINDEEMKLIKKRGCVVAVNVSSNMNNGVGLPNILKMKKEGIKLIIGNDGISPSIINEWPTILFSMHNFYNSPTDFNFTHLLEMIEDTYEYANTILGTKLGRIEVGYDSDLLITPYIPPTPLDETNGLGHLIFGISSSFKPKHVFCRGKHIVKNYEVSKALTEKYKLAISQSEVLWNKIHKYEVKNNA